jgi:hypothetical protein
MLCLVDETDTYTKTTQQQYLNNVLSFKRTFVAFLRVIQGLPDAIDPDKPPTNYKDHDAMSSPDNQEWAEAYQKEFQGFKDRVVFAQSGHPKELRSLGLTRVPTIKSIMVYWINEDPHVRSWESSI